MEREGQWSPKREQLIENVVIRVVPDLRQGSFGKFQPRLALRVPGPMVTSTEECSGSGKGWGRSSLPFS